MSKEAMKLALEALEKLMRLESDSWELGSCRVAGQAIKALREALSAPLAEQPAPVAKPHEQEPVAWRVWRGDAYELFFSKYAADRRADCFTKRPDVEPLYTSPPASKPWVGLTPEDKVEILRANGEAAVLILTEAKLKEKNK